ncbi:hcalcium-binding protein, partial [[Haemophilus] felis]|nr:hcalcium-binding protein [[Haemophilus] felis]
MSNDNMALLAAAAYGKFTDINDIDKTKKALTDEKISESQAKKFTDTYEILLHKPNTASGYSGTFVRNKKTGVIFLSNRGTEFSIKDTRDIVADGELVLTGLARQQVEDAKRFVNDAIRSGIINEPFINVGHSLGKTIGDAIHFTTDLSQGSIGFNGSGLSFWKGSLNVDAASRYISDVPDSKFAGSIKNRILLEKLASEGGNTFNSNKDGVINIVSYGPSLVASALPYNQHGKTIYFNNGTFGNHSIKYFVEPMEDVENIRGNYNLSYEESIKLYNTAREHYEFFLLGRSDKSDRKLHQILDNFIVKNDNISKDKLLTHVRKSFLTENKEYFRMHIPWPDPSSSNITPKFSNYRYWPDPSNSNITPKNRLSLTPSSEISKDKNVDFDYFSVTNRLSLGFNKQALNESTKTADLASVAIVTDDIKVANHNLVPNKSIDIRVYEATNKTSPNANSTRIPRLQGSPHKKAIDPLILDLNGDGARAVSYTEKPVLFDIDNDGGSLEETGWLSNQDGLLVKDLNNNGKIDNISEVFSEYYAGRAGRNGEAGEKPFANGFEALKSLDSNKDNVFDSKDRDFNVVRVWQDKNHNGVTDAGELKTLSSLKITAIDLAYENAGGQLFFGNELLAKGYFTRNGKKHEAAAVNFLANPRGHTITNVSGGKKTVTEAAGVLAKTSSFTAEGNQARALEAKKLGVMNIQAGNGNDTLRGDEQ